MRINADLLFLMSDKNKKFKKTIVLLDAHAILHRAYHAMGGFATRDGKPTGALYGFITMVLRIEEDIKPDYIVACYDLPKPTFRHTAYDGYKSGRQKTDDELISQIKESWNLCKALNIPIYSFEGFEADDILGTIAHQLKKDKDTRIVIASGDMDTMQLIDDDKVVVYTLKKATDTVMYNRDAVISRYGFPPEHIPDYKGLSGDPSDNIKGIKGIGEKTATSLIQNFGTIEQMYKVLRKNREKFLEVGIKERIIGLLEEGEDDALFSKTLATIRCDVPVNFTFPNESWRDGISIDEYQKLCDEFEFRSLRNRLSVIENEIKNEHKKEVEPEKVVEISKEKLDELKVMTQLLDSEKTNPSLLDIQQFTGKKEADDMEKFLLGEIKKENLFELYENVEKPIISIIKKMEDVGIVLDKDVLKNQSEELHKTVKGLEEDIYKMTGETFNIASPKQLAEVLYEKMALGTKIKKTSTGAKSTNISELEKIKDEHPVVEKIIEYRELTKLLSTYIDALPLSVKEDGRIHAHFVQTGTGTGRFSCEDPNLQNLPIKSELGMRVRLAFVADKNKKLLSCDYAQVDLRAAAILSGDKNLVDIFVNKIDAHTGTAMKMFNVSAKDVTPDMRRKAKTINFGILYGMGVTALKDGMGVERKEAQEFYDQYKATFVRLMEYLEEVKVEAFKKGYTTTLLGRRRRVPLLKSPLPFLRAQGERIAINAPIQGTSADIIKLAMIDADEYILKNNLGSKIKLSLQIHDELVFEIDEDIAESEAKNLSVVLENVLKKRKLSDLPLEVSGVIGNNLSKI